MTLLPFVAPVMTKPYRHPGLDPGSSLPTVSALKGEFASWTPDQVRGDDGGP
jgi:hypothetical protein